MMNNRGFAGILGIKFVQQHQNLLCLMGERTHMHLVNNRITDASGGG